MSLAFIAPQGTGPQSTIKPITPSISIASAATGVLAHPALPAIAANPTLSNIVIAAKTVQAAQMGQKYTPSVSDLLDLEHDLYLDPVFTMRRHFRVYVCPGTVDASGNATFTPQRDCVPFRMHIPSGSAAGKTVRQLQSGVDQYFVTADAVDATIYSEHAIAAIESAFLRPIVTTVGKKIEASTTLASTTRLGMWCFDLSDEGVIAAPYNRPVLMGQAGVVVVHAAAAMNVDLFQQKSFRIRHLNIDDTDANWSTTIDATHGLSVNSILVGNDPQTEDSLPLPATMFVRGVLAGMFDGDWGKVGKKTTVVLQNNDAAHDYTTSVTWWGDSLDD
jgi:hypothetical protein